MLINNISWTRFFIILALGIMILGLPLAYSADDKNNMELFEGGQMDGHLFFRNSLLTGYGVYGALRGMNTPAVCDPFILFGNPAILGNIKETQAAFTFSPPFEVNLTSLYDPEATIKEEVDAALLESFNVTRNRTYPTLTARTGGGGLGLSGLAVSIPIASSKGDGIHNFIDRFAFGYYRPVAFNMGTIVTGLRTRIRTNEEKPEDEIVMYTSIKMNADIQVTADQWKVAVAKQMDKFWFGLNAGRTDIIIKADGYQRTDGIMSRAEVESAFNDDRDPWENSYYSKINTDWSAASLNLGLGASWQPTTKWLFGLTTQFNTSSDLEGDLDLVKFSFPALRLNAEEGEDNFDTDKIEDVTEMTRTYSTDYEVKGTPKLKLPQSATLGITFLGPVKPSLNFTTYFGELSYNITLRENNSVTDFTRGFKPKWKATLHMDLVAVQLGLGAISMDEVISGYKDSKGNSIPPKEGIILPVANVGFDMSLSENLMLGILMIALPDDMFRLSLTYRL